MGCSRRQVRIAFSGPRGGWDHVNSYSETLPHAWEVNHQSVSGMAQICDQIIAMREVIV